MTKPITSLAVMMLHCSRHDLLQRRSVGSYRCGGIYNTHFWIDPKEQIAVAVLMQVLPYYDDAAIQVLRGVERLVYQHLRVGS